MLLEQVSVPSMFKMRNNSKPLEKNRSSLLQYYSTKSTPNKLDRQRL